jgi:hypothetical protein
MHEALPAGGNFSHQNFIEEEFPRLPLVPSAEFYARIPFEQAFDVTEILYLASSKKELPYGQPMYVVDFASRAKPGIDYQQLIDYDTAAHREAAASDGFLLYFRGDLDPMGYNRSFCVWESLQHAKAASAKPAHAAAAQIAEEMYSFYRVTMREARLTPSPKGYEFGVEHSVTVGHDELGLAA